MTRQCLPSGCKSRPANWVAPEKSGNAVQLIALAVSEVRRLLMWLLWSRFPGAGEVLGWSDVAPATKDARATLPLQETRGRSAELVAIVVLIRIGNCWCDGARARAFLRSPTPVIRGGDRRVDATRAIAVLRYWTHNDCHNVRFLYHRDVWAALQQTRWVEQTVRTMGSPRQLASEPLGVGSYQMNLEHA